MDATGYRIKSFLTEIRYPNRFRINSDVWDILDLFPPESVGFLTSGGVTGTNPSDSNDYTVEFNRSHFLVENIDNLSQLEEWIKKSAKLINQVVHKWRIPKLDRVGIRFHLMCADKEKHGQDFYAQFIGTGVDIIKNRAIANSVSTGGIVFRFKLDDWDVRFGAFSADLGVMHKYHKYHKRGSVFTEPGLIYDIDFSKISINTEIESASALTPKFDAASYIREAQSLAEGLMKKHLESLSASKNP